MDNVTENTITKMTEAEKRFYADWKKYKFRLGLCGFIAILGVVMSGFLYKQVSDLKELIGNLDTNFSTNVNDGRKVYVFNTDKAIEGIGLPEISRKFEEDIYDLDRQVKEAQDTIKDIKEEEVKNKVLTMSVKPLQMKRDELLEAYSKATQDALNNINNALAQIAAEDNIPTIFINKSVAVNTNYVIDVTDRVVEMIKKASGEHTAESQTAE